MTAEVLTVALELSGKSWKVALQDGKRNRPALHTADAPCAAARLRQVAQLIDAAKRKWGLAETARVVGLYEAGQDGFWISRALTAQGIDVLVVDPASIPVERHARRAKTDRLDVQRLLVCLRRWLRGERDGMRVVHAPSPEGEAQRQLVRERGQLQKEIGQHRDRIRKLLRTVGAWDGVHGDIGARLAQEAVRCHDGSRLPPQLQARLLRESERLALAEKELQELEASLLAQLPAPVQERIGRLKQLRAVGAVGATRLVLELYWRHFGNRRQVGACVGLVPQPYDSGGSRVDQGISKQGNRRVRSLLIEMAWLWLRYQGGSALAQWFAKRCSGAGKRGRRVAIVAVARKLAIALWRYLEEGEIPAGARMKAA
jgi:transposase